MFLTHIYTWISIKYLAFKDVLKLYLQKQFFKKRCNLTQNQGSLANMLIVCMSCCSNATGPIAIIAKTSFSNTTMTIITMTTTIRVHRSPSTIC